MNNMISSNATILNDIADILRQYLPPVSFPKGLSTYNYMWRFKLPETAYKSLLDQARLLDLKEKGILEKDIQGYITKSTTVARLIVLLMAEWYKRDSESLKGDNVMDIFGNSKVIPAMDKIWSAAKLPDTLLHKAKIKVLRQTAACVLGGFPLHFANASIRFKKLIDILSCDDADIEANSWDELFDEKNSVFSGSLKEGSCKAYVEQLRKFIETNDESYLPFDANDLKNSAFSKFIELTHNGYDEKVRDGFFSNTFNFFTVDEDTDVQAQMKLQLGFKKDRCVIFASQLRSLGIDVGQADRILFRLGTTDYNKEVHYSNFRYYDKVGNDRPDFAGVGSSVVSIDFNLFNTEKITLEVIDSGMNVIFSRNYTVEPAFELYRDMNRAFCWTTKKDNTAAADKVLLLDYSIYQNLEQLSTFEKRSANMEDSRPIWCWARQSETIELTDVDGNKHPFNFEHNEKLLVEFQHSDIDNAIKSTKGMVEAVRNGMSSYIPLLRGRITNKGRLNFNLQVSSPSNGHYRRAQEYKLEFKDQDARNYASWTESTQPQQGFLTIRISTKAKGTASHLVDVYYIPDRVPVVRNLDTKTICFNSVKDVYYYDSETEDYKLIEGNAYTDVAEKNLGKDFNLFYDVVPFRVGKQDNHITLNVYRAFWMQAMFRDGKPLNVKSTAEIREIPVLLHDCFKILTIDDKGSWRSGTIDSPLDLDYFVHPSRLCDDIPTGKNYYLYIYRNVEVHGNKISIKADPKYKDEYRFYYWSGNCTQDAIVLESSYCEQTEVLTIDCSGHSDSKGVVFQSLKNCKPNNYYRPIYVRLGQPFSLRTSPHINGQIYSLDDILHCYEMLKDHKVYISIFSCLYKLRENVDFCIHLLKYVLKKNHYILDQKSDDLKLLNRIARESGIDWLLMPRSEITAIVRDSNEYQKSVIYSLRNLFEFSPLIKENTESHLHERYYFKRIFIEDDRYFQHDVLFDKMFHATKYKRKESARKFVELVGNKQSNLTFGSKHKELISKCSDHENYIHLFHDIFYQYIIR